MPLCSLFYEGTGVIVASDPQKASSLALDVLGRVEIPIMEGAAGASPLAMLKLQAIVLLSATEAEL